MSSNRESPYSQFKERMRKSRLISLPKNNISTFGNTIYNYYFVGKISENQTQVREGHVKIKRPLFITPFTSKEILKGFAPDHEMMMKQLLDDIQSENRFLVEYQFEHIPRHSWMEKIPYHNLLGEIRAKHSNSHFDVLVTGEPEHWRVSLIKFCLKMIEKSFPINFSELEERGFLDKNRIPPQTRKKVEEFFISAENDYSQIQILGDYLVDNKIFDFFEERFFALMEKSKRNV